MLVKWGVEKNSLDNFHQYALSFKRSAIDQYVNGVAVCSMDPKNA